MLSFSLSRIVHVLLLLVASATVLYYGRVFLVPIAFAALLAMLLAPVGNWLEGRGLGRVASSLLCLLLLCAFLGGVGWVLGTQASHLVEQWPQIRERGLELWQHMQQWVDARFGVPPDVQMRFVQEHGDQIRAAGTQYLAAPLAGLGGLLSGFVQTLLYLFFLLWGRSKFRAFFLQLVADEHRLDAAKMLDEIARVSGQYLVGRLFSMLFLASFYGVGFSIIGLDDALLLAAIAVLPTLIPYLGAYLGGLFPLAMALIAGEPNQALPTLGVLVAAQVIDNNLIEPLVMGNRLNLSPIFTIVGIVAGELLWGIPGMILFEPLFAVLRIVCSHVPALAPFAYLMANEVEEPGWVRKLKELVTRRRST